MNMLSSVDLSWWFQQCCSSLFVHQAMNTLLQCNTHVQAASPCFTLIFLFLAPCVMLYDRYDQTPSKNYFGTKPLPPPPTATKKCGINKDLQMCFCGVQLVHHMTVFVIPPSPPPPPTSFCDVVKLITIKRHHSIIWLFQSNIKRIE